jgi:hypothetical protein
MTLSIALIAFLTYAPMLRYYFTATDSLTLIDTSRIHSLKGATKLFTQPLMAGTEFANGTLYYRPISSLSYSLDYYMWGLNPFGYHLTDLALHITVSALVLVAMLSLTGARKAISWLSAVIFATHPILVETVPAIARRQDVIAALFLLLSLVFFLNHVSTPARQRKWSLASSVLAYAFALGAKEIAILLPLIICGYLLFFAFMGGDEHKSFRVGTFQCMKICFPYFAVTVIYIVWRAYVLRGLPSGVSTITIDEWSLQTTFAYFIDLLYPVPLHYVVPRNLIWAISLATLFVLLLLVFIRGKGVLMNVRRSGDRRARRVLRLFFGAVALLSLIGILSYPLVSPLIDELVKQAYYGRGLLFLTAAMESRYSNPLAYYLDRVEMLSLTSLFVSFGVSLAGLWLMNGSSQLKRLLTHSRVGKIVAFLLVWLLLPLGLFLVTRRFDHKYMYIPAIPFSAILSIVLIENLRVIVRKLAAKQAATNSRWLPYAASGLFIIASGLTVYLLSFSPLVRTYGEWEDSGKISAVILRELSKTVTELPDRAAAYTLHVYDLPVEIVGHDTAIPHVRSAALLLDYSIKSYLDLTDPDNRIRVIVETETVISTRPRDIDLVTTLEPGNNVVAIVRLHE